MQTFIWIIQIIAAVVLIALILMHSPKGDGIAAFGGTSQLFSSQKNAEKGLNKLTMYVAIVFIVCSFILAYCVIK